MFTKAVKAATEDDGFLQLQSNVAKTGLCVAKAILLWINEPRNISQVNETSELLTNKLKEFLKSSKATREKLWVSFFDYIKSDEYSMFWSSTVKLAKTENSPVLFQPATFCMILYIKCTQ